MIRSEWINSRRFCVMLFIRFIVLSRERDRGIDHIVHITVDKYLNAWCNSIESFCCIERTDFVYLSRFLRNIVDLLPFLDYRAAK